VLLNTDLVLRVDIVAVLDALVEVTSMRGATLLLLLLLVALVRV